MKHTWHFFFFRKSFNFMHLCMALFVGLLSFVFILLVYQYRHFKEVTTQLCELKEEYRVYTISLKKMVDQQSLLQTQESEGDQKKKLDK